MGVAPSAVTEERPGRYVVQAAGTPALVAGLTAWMADHDVALGDLQAGRRSLEEVFLTLTAEAAADGDVSGEDGGSRRRRGGRR
jgi:ABC-2 type transport system ATP-binding protein